MGKWTKTVDFKALMKPYKDKTDLDSLKELGVKFAALMKAELGMYLDSASDSFDYDLDELHDRFNDGDFEYVDEFDELLNELYDWCDANRIWTGI